jgi:hypothetical protein
VVTEKVKIQNGVLLNSTEPQIEPINTREELAKKLAVIKKVKKQNRVCPIGQRRSNLVTYFITT